MAGKAETPRARPYNSRGGFYPGEGRGFDNVGAGGSDQGTGATGGFNTIQPNSIGQDFGPLIEGSKPDMDTRRGEGGNLNAGGSPGPSTAGVGWSDMTGPQQAATMSLNNNPQTGFFSSLLSGNLTGAIGAAPAALGLTTGNRIGDTAISQGLGMGAKAVGVPGLSNPAQGITDLAMIAMNSQGQNAVNQSIANEMATPSNPGQTTAEFQGESPQSVSPTQTTINSLNNMSPFNAIGAARALTDGLVAPDPTHGGNTTFGLPGNIGGRAPGVNVGNPELSLDPPQTQNVTVDNGPTGPTGPPGPDTSPTDFAFDPTAFDMSGSVTGGPPGGGQTGDTSGTSGEWSHGGFVNMGNPQSQHDDVPAMLEHGEYVIPRPAMERLAQATGGLPQAAEKVKELIMKYANTPTEADKARHHQMFADAQPKRVSPPSPDSELDRMLKEADQGKSGSTAGEESARWSNARRNTYQGSDLSSDPRDAVDPRPRSQSNRPR